MLNILFQVVEYILPHRAMQPIGTIEHGKVIG
jgi:hypothetical protein